ncbi:MAG TPA: carbon-nitrogen hydrolase family protein [Candidatus Saccharimonadales bacterium]|nr:carbon-nitrogen hydrolase family protein [Candidatus Saccharimonadales bacterium]
MSRLLKAAVAQLGPSDGDKQATVLRMEKLVDQAAEAGVKMLLFPELALTPFFPGTLKREFDDWFDSLPSPLTEGLLARVRHAKMVVVLPYAEKDGVAFYNSALVFDADGRIAGKYRKVHIPAYFPTGEPGGTGSFEKLYFRPSDDGFPVFDTAYGRVGVQICYDRMFPEGSRILALKGAEVVFYPHDYSLYGMPYRQRAWGRLVQARAYENGFFAVLANKAGQAGERQNGGRSMVITPFGGDILAEGSPDREELVLAEIDLDDVAEARRRLPWWRDRRPEMYRELVQGPRCG